MAQLALQTLHVDISRALHLRDDVVLQDVKFSYVHVSYSHIHTFAYILWNLKFSSASGNLLPYLTYLISIYLTYIFISSYLLKLIKLLVVLVCPTTIIVHLG